MKPNQASKTAQYMALFRAMETQRPQKDRLFSDPYAISYLSNFYKLVVFISAIPFVWNYVSRIIYKKIPGAFSSGIARTKYIDDLLDRTIKNGVQQVIILGAGFDTRSVRVESLKKMSVIEIDHPNTARLKTQTLSKIFGQLPANTKYYQIDFNKQSLYDIAHRYGIDFSIPTTFIWEGVTNYLNEEAVRNTFEFVGKFIKGSYVIFTYIDLQILHNPDQFTGGKKLLADLDAIEERWTYGFDPSNLASFLRQSGLTLVEDMGAGEYREQYIPARNEKGYEFYRVALAEKND